MTARDVIADAILPTVERWLLGETFISSSDVADAILAALADDGWRVVRTGEIDGAPPDTARLCYITEEAVYESLIPEESA